MSWFQKLLPSTIRTNTTTKKSIPEGLWTKCDACSAILFRAELERNLDVCPKCQHHRRIPGRKRLEVFLDQGPLEELGASLEPHDRFKFKDTKRYKDRISAAQKASGEKDALVSLKGTLHGMPVVACAFDFNFIGGSMGAIVGERFVLAAEKALQENLPFICFATSGGARMQESLISLMQMGKTSAALRRLSDAGVPYISVMLDPCMGGVSASLAMLGDVNIAEPKALIGFSGPRVIQQTIGQTLPEGFQRSEFLLEHGVLDMIVDRRDLRDTIASIIAKMTHQPCPIGEEQVKERADEQPNQETIHE